MSTQPLTAQDVRDARETYHKAMDAATKAKGTTRQAEAAMAEYEAQAAYYDALRRGGHLEHIECAEQIETARQQVREQEQAAFSVQKENDAKADAQRKYLAAGGDLESFSENWPSMWKQILRRDTVNSIHLTGEDETITKLRKTGRYN